MIKWCNKCLYIKDINDFYKHKTTRDGYRHDCKECSNMRCKGNRKKRGAEYHNEKSRAYTRNNRDKIVAYYGGKLKCSTCGLEDPCFSVYDFHHLDRTTKTERIGALVNRGWYRIEAELKKCIVLCANCHRRLHNEENKKNC